MINKGFLLDSTALIDFLRGNENLNSLLGKLAQEAPLAVSAVTIAELYSGIRKSEITKTERLLESLCLYLIDGQIARRAGLYQRNYRQKGISLGLADCFIAATAVENDLTLVTKNVRHFPMAELAVIEH